MAIPIIGQINHYEQEREAVRMAMRLEQRPKQKAQLKREFRALRDKVNFLKDNMRER